jgi:hypothetical protein
MRLRDHLQPMLLADDALVERVGELEDRLHFVLHHAADGDARPVRNHRGHGLLVHRRKNQRALALHRVDLRLQLHAVLRAAPPCLRSLRRWGRATLALASPSALASTGLLPARNFARSSSSRSTSSLLFLPPCIQCIELHLRFAQQRRHLRSALGHVDADGLFAPDDFLLDREPSMRRMQSSTSGGVACWLTATRAQAVSSRLTALSGNWRAGM